MLLIYNLLYTALSLSIDIRIKFFYTDNNSYYDVIVYSKSQNVNTYYELKSYFELRFVYMNNEQIVNSIKSICKEHNITVTKLEETLGMSQGLISRWNKSDPSLSKIIDIAQYFNLSLDDIVGYKNCTNDKFIEKLIVQTASGSLKWFNYNHPQENPKQYSELSSDDFRAQEEQNKPYAIDNEISYFSHIGNGYISLYGTYHDNNIKNPSTILLFIQPDCKASLIKQNYSKQQLISLWLKVLYSLNEEAPDEIKAEELKNSFILENNEKEHLNFVPYETIKTFLNDSEFTKVLETINSKEFENVQQTLSNPEFQTALQTIKSIQKNLNTNHLFFHQEED